MLELLESLLIYDQTSKSPNHRRILALETAQATTEGLADAPDRQITVVEAISHRAELIAIVAPRIPHASEIIGVDLGTTTDVRSRLVMVDETTSIDMMGEDEADHALLRIVAMQGREAKCEMVDWKMICHYQDVLLKMFQTCKSFSLMILIVNSSNGPRSRFKQVVCV